MTRTVEEAEGLRWGSVGKLVGGCEVRIVDVDSGVSLGPNKRGELWVKGPIVMKGEIICQNNYSEF